LAKPEPTRGRSLALQSKRTVNYRSYLAAAAHPSGYALSWPDLFHGSVQVRVQVYRAFKIFVPPKAVMAGLVPAIHVPRSGSKKGVDHRDEPGDDN
jgi:hypothetical protein